MHKLNSQKFVSYCLLFLLVLFLRSLLTVPIEIYGDSIRRWNYAIHYSTNLYPFLETHQTMRWGINLPGVLAYRLFGPYPSSYYVAPLIFYALSFTMLIVIASKIMRVSLLILLALLIFFEPMNYNSSTQFHPVVFGLCYIVGACIFYNKWAKTQFNKHLALSAFLLFCAYGAKAPYIYFLPGLLLLCLWEFGLRAALKFLGFFFLYFSVEWTIFNFYSEQLLPLGRLSALRFTHNIGGQAKWRTKPSVYLDYITMWLDVPVVYFALLIASLGLVLYCLRTKRILSAPRSLKCMTLMLGSFIVLNMSLIVNFKTFQTPQGPFSKYLTILMPLICFVFCGWLQQAIHNIKTGFLSRLIEISIRVFCVVTLVLGLSLLRPSPEIVKHRRSGPHTDAYVFRINSHFKAVGEWLNSGNVVYLHGRNVGDSANRRDFLIRSLQPYITDSSKLVYTHQAKHKYLIHLNRIDPASDVAQKEFSLRKSHEYRKFLD